jgi:hypothetical protein
MTGKRKPLQGHRSIVPNDDGKPIYSEQRGVLSLTWDLSNEGVRKASFSEPQYVEDFRVLSETADLLFEELGVEGPDAISRRVQEDKDSQPLEERLSKELFKLVQSIALAHGVHSLAAIAARFGADLCLLKYQLQAGIPVQIERMIGFSDAYRAFHFERFGGHEKAVKASKVDNGQMRAEIEKARRKVLQRKEIELYCRPHLEAAAALGKAVRASSLAKKIHENLNDSLSARHLPEISVSLLRREVRALIRRGTNGVLAAC